VLIKPELDFLALAYSFLDTEVQQKKWMSQKDPGNLSKNDQRSRKPDLKGKGCNWVCLVYRKERLEET